jgi:hypothetical protein
MGKKRTKFSDQIRAAVDASAIRRAHICKDLDWSPTTMSLFMSHQRGLSMTALDDLAEYLGMEVVVKRKKRS